MSQQQWQPQSRSPGGGGSVRRARERMEAGLPPEIPQQPQGNYGTYDPPRAAPKPPMNRSRPQMPPALATSRNGQGPIGVAISRPTQVPQWPLAATIKGSDSRGDQQYQPPPGRSMAPQRPPRPSHVPSMLDASRLQEATPSFQNRPPQNLDQGQGRGGRFQEEEMGSPVVASPMTQSSRPSTISSVGSIPDFPVPMPPPPGPPRRSANLGPPPSARRGASSYYSQASFVSPIPEESPRTQASHGSYASSAAIPSNWGSEDSPGFDYDEEDEDDDLTERRFGFRHDIIEEGRESRESNMDDNDDRGLIRSASLGKRAKPSMITTKSSDRVDPVRQGANPQQTSKLETMGAAAGVAGLTTARMNDARQETVWPMIGNSDSPLASGTGLIDKSTSSSETSTPAIARAITADEPVPSIPNLSSAKGAAILGAFNSASSLQPGGTPLSRTPSPGFSRLSAIRRPPRLDIDAVRDAEARGSLTSLPDLIRRATKLAAMMDRGKRPASRLNDLNDFPMVGDEKENELISPNEKRRSGLSGMLAAFPPPGVATPRDGTPRPVSSWPSPYDPSNGPFNSEAKQKKRRRCCGLPCWGFLLVLLILLIIIAAAVVVPLELLVFNKPKTTPTLSAIQQCEANSTTACQNGGVSVLDTGVCACICTNGFTGSTCTVAGATGCAVATLSGSSVSNVTLGDSISRLISSAESNFSIPLSNNLILARFNSANLSCASENALVTFDGQSQRRGSANDEVTQTIDTSSQSSTSTILNRRGGYGGDYTTSSPDAAATSNGILHDTSILLSYTATTISESSAAPSSTSSPTTSSTSSSTSTAPTANFIVTEEVLDFSRTAVLYILQQEQLESAVNAQAALEKFFSLESFTNIAATNVSLGSGNTINLLGFNLDVGNGLIGAKNTTLLSRSYRRRSEKA